MAKRVKRKAENKTMEVILLKSDKHLGEKFQTVRVKPIFARNVLLPKEMAVLATLANKNKYGQMIVAAENERAKKAKSLEDLLMKIQEDWWITIIRKANKENTLYDKIDENDLIKEILEKYSIELQPHWLKLKKKITTTGTYTVPFIYQWLKKDIAVIAQGEIEKKAKKEEETTEEVKEEIKLSKEEMKAKKEEERAKKKEETLVRLKKKFK